MRRILALALACVLALVAVPAAADEIVGDGYLMHGRILRAWPRRRAGLKGSES